MQRIRCRLAAGAVIASLTLAGCSGGSSTGAAAAKSAAATSGPNSLVAVPGGPCDTATMAKHVASAVGATRQYLWKPSSAHQLVPTGDAAVLARAKAAARFVAAEYATAKSKVTGCANGLPLVNALGTGISLAKAAGTQLASGGARTDTVAGLNSVGGTILAQAKVVGVTVRPTVPTARDLAAVQG